MGQSSCGSSPRPTGRNSKKETGSAPRLLAAPMQRSEGAARQRGRRAMSLPDPSRCNAVTRACARSGPISGYLRSRHGGVNGQKAFNASATGASPCFPKALGGKTPGGTSRLSQMLAGRSPRTTPCLFQTVACGKLGPHQAATTRPRAEGTETGRGRVSRPSGRGKLAHLEGARRRRCADARPARPPLHGNPPRLENTAHPTVTGRSPPQKNSIFPRARPKKNSILR